MPRPKYYKSELRVAGSDSVDELVRRCEGNFERAESLMHAMLDNYLAFDDLRRGNVKRQELAAAVELDVCLDVFQDTLKRWVSGEVNIELVETHMDLVKKMGTEVQRLQGALLNLPPIPHKMKGCI